MYDIIFLYTHIVYIYIYIYTSSILYGSLYGFQSGKFQIDLTLRMQPPAAPPEKVNSGDSFGGWEVKIHGRKNPHPLVGILIIGL